MYLNAARGLYTLLSVVMTTGACLPITRANLVVTQIDSFKMRKVLLEGGRGEREGGEGEREGREGGRGEREEREGGEGGEGERGRRGMEEEGYEPFLTYVHVLTMASPTAAIEFALKSNSFRLFHKKGCASS